MSNIPIISIKDSISSHLAIRKSAISFFEKEVSNIPSEQLKIDFSNVLSMNHSFAHEYIVNKRSSLKQIEEINVPSNVLKMFEMAKNSIDVPRKHSESQAQEITKGELKLES